MRYNNVIRSNDPQVIEKLTENVKHIEERLSYMQTVNDYYKEHGTTKGCPGIDDETAVKLDARVNENQSTPYPGKFFTDNRADLKRLQGNIECLINNRESVFNGWQFEGGEAVINLANNRLQLMFNTKPGIEQINTLKKNGFKWAPTQKAWQRPLDYKSMSAADRIDFIKPQNGMRPTELQPKVPKKNAPER